jgi:hypothetical protein
MVSRYFIKDIGFSIEMPASRRHVQPPQDCGSRADAWVITNGVTVERLAQGSERPNRAPMLHFRSREPGKSRIAPASPAWAITWPGVSLDSV